MILFDVIIVGGGPAGMNAAMVLGRCRRQVLLFDTGRQRNRSSHGMHNYLTRDGILPMDFIKQAQIEIEKYGVVITPMQVSHVDKTDEGIFLVKDIKENLYHAKKILIATGLADTLPDLEGIEQFYGHSVFHCPYCDGWEVKDQELGVYASNKNAFELTLSLLTWSKSVTYYSNGKNYLSAQQAAKLQQHGITIIQEPVLRLEGTDDQLKTVVLENNESRLCDALFFSNGYEPQCDLVANLGCTVNKQGVVIANNRQQTNIRGVYVAGDACKDMHFVVVAAAEGAKAGVTINKELQSEELV